MHLKALKCNISIQGVWSFPWAKAACIILVSFCINRKAKAFCVLPQLYIPSETVRKILFHSLKMEVSVTGVSLLNLLTTFSSAFLKGLLKSFSCSKQYPSSAVRWDVQFCGLLSSGCSGHFSNFIFECENDNEFLGFNSKHTFPKTTVILYWTCSVLELPSFVITAFSIAFALSGGVSSLNYEGQKLLSFLLAKKSQRSPSIGDLFLTQSTKIVSSHLLDCPLPILVSPSGLYKDL